MLESHDGPRPKRRLVKSKQVVKANALVEASYRLTLLEKQVILLAVAQIEQGKVITAETPFIVSAHDLIDIFRVNSTGAYRQLQDAAEQLYGRSVLIDRPDPEDPDLEKTKTRWVHAIDYKPKKGVVRLYFAPKIIPYLSCLAREFTQYRLQNTSGMTSIYAVRIYELLVQWKTRGELDIELEWLREKFDLPPSYSGISDLKKRVIQPAIEQINEHSDLWVKVTQRKKGRVVMAFIFTFGEKNEKKQKACVATTERRIGNYPTREEMERAARPGESWDDVRRRLLG